MRTGVRVPDGLASKSDSDRSRGPPSLQIPLEAEAAQEPALQEEHDEGVVVRTAAAMR